MSYYKDLREHVKALEANNKLVRIKREINKDIELMPLVRWQFRGLPEEERKAFLFENVVDVNAHPSHLALVDLHLMEMGCRMRDAPRRAPVVLPEIRPEPILKCPLDGLGVGVDADTLVPENPLPPA